MATLMEIPILTPIQIQILILTKTGDDFSIQYIFPLIKYIIIKSTMKANQENNIPIIVLDANAFISGENLLHLGTNNQLVTSPEVME